MERTSMRGDKARAILTYLEENPDDTQADISRALGLSRQVVHYTLKQYQMIPPRREILPAPLCKYCNKPVDSMLYQNLHGVDTYHKACMLEANMYHGICPVCRRSFKRQGSKVQRGGQNGKPTSGLVTCSHRCRLQALHQGLFKEAIQEQDMINPPYY